jgi:tryptophanyl-tRNA synthetase
MASLLNKLGCQEIAIGADQLLNDFYLIRRRVFFAQRNLQAIFGYSVAATTATTKGGPPFYVFTGRGPSSASLHFGHLVPFLMVRHLQRTFQCPVVVQMADDEKFFQGKPTFVPGNVREIAPFVQGPRTRILVNSQLDWTQHDFIRRVQRELRLKDIKRHFGYTDEHCLGLYAYVATQIFPCFPQCIFGDGQQGDNLNCLVVAGFDQFPYFSLAHRVHRQLKTRHTVGLLYSDLLPALKGPNSKASSSRPETAIFVSDSDELIRRKMRGAFSSHHHPDHDIAMCYIRVFLEDDKEYEDLRGKYHSGLLTSLQLKDYCAQLLINVRNNYYILP